MLGADLAKLQAEEEEAAEKNEAAEAEAKLAKIIEE